MTTYELTGKFVADGAVAVRNGRIFVAFKRPNEQRNTLHEVKLAPSLQLIPIGLTPGAYHKDGGCALGFDDVSGELWMLAFCSPTTTGGDARPVLWRTGIIVAPSGAAGTVDAWARQQLALHEARLDKIANAAVG